MNDRHGHAAPLQSPSRFQTEQTASDDHRPFVRPRGGDHCLNIGDVAERADARQLETGNGQCQRL